MIELRRSIKHLCKKDPEKFALGIEKEREILDKTFTQYLAA